MNLYLGPGEVAELERRVQRAFELGDAARAGLRPLGYGEISMVVGWRTRDGRSLACKRLPPFRDRAAVDRYRSVFEAYVNRLSAAGVPVLPTSLAIRRNSAEDWAVWCVQPEMPAHALVPHRLSRCHPDEGASLFRRILTLVQNAVGATLGLDAQLSNWFADGDGPHYADVTTPLLRDEAGRERLDAEVFLASLPRVIRWPTRRFLLGSILATYYSPRRVVRDLLANLYKERLETWLPRFLEEANRTIRPPLSVSEVRAYYRRDARTWAWLQTLRRTEAEWQRRVRRRPYPFLLPGRIERHV